MSIGCSVGLSESAGHELFLIPSVKIIVQALLRTSTSAGWSGLAEIMLRLLLTCVHYLWK